MLFNSYEFIFLFLPITLGGFYFLGRLSRQLALGWIILASLVFYAWWRPLNVLIIGPSILINYGIARWLGRLGADERRPRLAQAVLLVGVAFNIAFLGYFKYIDFLATVANDLVGTRFVLTQVILPLGISFITFQKIAFLVDVHGGRIPDFSLREYGLFVLFFPQLIAGPIVHYREMMPQFERSTCRFNKNDFAAGLSLVAFGLVKKVVLADGIAEHVSPIYDMAASGAHVGLVQGWIAAIGFTLQIYFDFSGYSDMALGLARFFGVRLPANFDSPLKANSIIDFWLRWHMTLTRFLTAYVYNPLVLWLTRRRLAKKLPMLSSRSPSLGAFVQLLALPTLLTMLVSGLWHGAGYTFLLWGLMHGIFLCINHAWRWLRPKVGADKRVASQRTRVGSLLTTFVAVAVAMVVFRSPNLSTAVELLRSMVGVNGITLPQQIYQSLTPLLGPLGRALSPAAGMSTQDLAVITGWIVVLMAIALWMPNTLQILSHIEPAIGIQERHMPVSRLQRFLQWSPTPSWALTMVALAGTAIWRMGGKSEFLYWQF